VGGFPSRTCIGPETPQAVMGIQYPIHYPCMDEFLTMNKFDFPAKIFIPFVTVVSQPFQDMFDKSNIFLSLNSTILLHRSPGTPFELVV
jgi:hypothetical protein